MGVGLIKNLFNGARGYAYIEILGVVMVVAMTTAIAIYAHRIATFHADVEGVATAFKRLEQAERVWHDEGGANDYSFQDLTSTNLLPALQVHSSNIAGYAELPFVFELTDTSDGFSTLIANEAKAQQIAARLGSKASLVAEDDQFRLSYRPKYLASLDNLVDDHAIHAKGSNQNQLDQLNFNDGALVTIGQTCGFRDGKWHGGLAIDRASGKVATCRRFDLTAGKPDRVWQIAGEALPPTTPLPKDPPDRTTEYCIDLQTPYTSSCCSCTSLEQRQTVSQSGLVNVVLVTCSTQPSCDDGTAVCDVTTDCQDCWDGSNIPITNNCPSFPSLEYCDDGTPVSSTDDCKDCWHGTVGPNETCRSQPACGDGTLVTDTSTDCKDCTNGSNVHIDASCPTSVDCPCGGTALALDQCPTVVLKSCTGGCSSVCPSDSCPAPTETGPTTCPTGYDLVESAGACSVERQCIKQAEPCPCGNTRQSDGTCPTVVKTRNDAKCTAGYTKEINETECTIDESCVKDCPCDGGTVTYPSSCPSISMQSCSGGCPDVCPTAACATPTRSGPTVCLPGHSLVETPGACTIEASCVKDDEPCPCNGTRQSDGTCPPVVKTRIPATCTTGYFKVDVETDCTIEETCVKDCPCGNGRVEQPTACPPVIKQRNPANCVSGYTKTIVETECEINESCTKSCPCDGTVVTYPDTCPSVEKQELGYANCPSGYTKVLASETACTITHRCELTCPCGLGSVFYPAACPSVDKTELGQATCPQDYVKVKDAETQCTITHSCQKACPCNNGTVVFPDICPSVSKTELGVSSCPSGYDRVVASETQCTITHRCEFTCPNGTVVDNKADCPTKSCPCNQPDVLDGEACPPFEKEVIGDLSCPSHPGFTWFVENETQCSVQKKCLCTDTVYTCWSGPNVCMNPRQVTITDVNGIEQTGFVCDNETGFY